MSRHGSSRSHAVPLLTLYDVPSTSTQPWAPSIWRIRFILNYKRLPYRTKWVEFQNVERTLREIGAPPSSTRSDGRGVYTLPVIVDPTRDAYHPRIISNANTIAEYLETTYPARPVFPEGSRALQNLFVHFVQEALSKPLLPIMVPLSHNALPEMTQDYFRGGNPPHHMLSGPQREQAWHAVKEQFDFLAMILDKNRGDGEGDGVVAMGHEVSYADFALCSVLIWIERMAAHDGWARAVYGRLLTTFCVAIDFFNFTTVF
ncbi:hypothetical protein CVT24_000975 [Panaeolus cyanescens]|uniref:GST N-terminal domain-containing protein n=1 Tax=Panaeolus cyanescens TaxID=181874 RepID=A0A409YCE5_9AGAR|nr:hypothetical protein CVT24_000975 [Panaeolus cyanescens]